MGVQKDFRRYKRYPFSLSFREEKSRSRKDKKKSRKNALSPSKKSGFAYIMVEISIKTRIGPSRTSKGDSGRAKVVAYDE